MYSGTEERMYALCSGTHGSYDEFAMPYTWNSRKSTELDQLTHQEETIRSAKNLTDYFLQKAHFSVTEVISI
jgi:hypothetical protein